MGMKEDLFWSFEEARIMCNQKLFEEPSDVSMEVTSFTATEKSEEMPWPRTFSSLSVGEIDFITFS